MSLPNPASRFRLIARMAYISRHISGYQEHNSETLSLLFTHDTCWPKYQNKYENNKSYGGLYPVDIERSESIITPKFSANPRIYAAIIAP